MIPRVEQNSNLEKLKLTSVRRLGFGSLESLWIRPLVFIQHPDVVCGKFKISADRLALVVERAKNIYANLHVIVALVLL